MKQNHILEKSFSFAVRIVRLNDYLVSEKKEFVLSKQILRSGTSIGANCRETVNASSKKDFINKFLIALKEADETMYWLELLKETGRIDKIQFDSMHKDCDELICLMTRIVKTTREKMEE